MITGHGTINYLHANAAQRPKFYQLSQNPRQLCSCDILFGFRSFQAINSKARMFLWPALIEMPYAVLSADR